MQPVESLELGTIIWFRSATLVRGSDTGGRLGLRRPASCWLPPELEFLPLIAVSIPGTGCAHGDYKCECGKKEELQGMIFNEVIENCGLLGGLDVVKAVSYLCDCDATATTFTACPTVAPTTTTSEPPIITEPPATPTDCGLDSWECAPLYSAVPSCATALIESAALEVGCPHGDYKCECSKKEELQGLIFNDVIDACGLLGGLDVVKAPSAEPSDGDDCDDDDEPTASSVIPVPSSQPSAEPSSQPPVTTTSSPGTQPSGSPTCGEESWACADEFAAIPTCAVDIIAEAAVKVGCAIGDHKCECSKNQEIQGLVFNDVIAACGVLGGLDVVKYVTYLCECDAANPTFTPCDGTPGPSSSAPVSVPSGHVTTTITTTDIVTSDCSTSTSDVVVPSVTKSVPGPEPSGPCGEESWECAAEFAAVPECAVPIIEKAALDLGCAAGDHKCECENKEKIQGTIALDVLGACGIEKVGDVLSSVEALCACDAAKPTFTPCDGSSGPGPTSSKPGPSVVPSGGSSVIPSGGPSGGPSSILSSIRSSAVVVPSSSPITSNPGPQPSASPCGIDSWECVDEFKAVPACAVPIIQEAALALGCAEGDHKCECSNAEKIQLSIALDVLGACGADKINDVLSSVEALCKCDSAKPTFTECGSNPGPTDGNGGGGGGSGPGPTGSSSSAGPIITTSAPVPSGGNGGGQPGPSVSSTSDCPWNTATPDGPCGIGIWECEDKYNAVPACAKPIIEEAAISIGCKKGDFKCECTNQEKIQGIVFNDVLSACGAATGIQVISAVEALCECDAAKPTFTECPGPGPTGICSSPGSGGGGGGGTMDPGGPEESSPATSNPGPGPTGGNGGGGGSGGGESSSFVTVTHSTTIITSAGPTGGGDDSGPTGGNGGGSGGGDDSGPTGGNGGGSGGSGPSPGPTGGAGDGDGDGDGDDGDVPVPEPSDAVPPPPITGAASKSMVSKGCVAVMAVVFAALL
ncbi:hypothetical protein B0T20DRAFT_460836 [Sordaria brevicollis]|uniref:CFEM domain-containing protein n=1 Tax=Sordaria brevicollis TaxID=83679 RepID=A0AAE0UCS2_SORBR|nr:hypothetical protein B0T20DRAFT_460836 [Sordaria brevicollis]